MNRRQFLRSAAGVFVAASLGAASLYRYLTRSSSEETGAAAGPAGSPSPSPAPASPTPTPTPQGPGKLVASLWLLSDLHITTYDPSTSDKLKKALADTQKPETPADAIVLGGDLTDYGMESDYRQLRTVLNGFKLPPVYANMGNHDYYDIWINSAGAFATETKPNGKTDAQSRERFMSFLKLEKPYSQFDANGIPVFLLSQEAYQQEKPEVGEGAWYSDAQLAWLKDGLARAPKGGPIVVMIHQPLPPVGSDGATHRVIRANELRDILAPYPNVFVFSGHTHRDFNSENHYQQHATFHWFTNSTVGRLRTTGLSQGMYIQLYEREIHVRGREFGDGTWIASADWTIPYTAGG
ncbi:hypothetical protein J31TS4_31640 [Paenibacillus sp. J31TS4]|uniref:metallophosphoesterase family protein n=1 Tax=Paenibacillus sp. J31TS4 TaxID=2807195 RepID=UPI001B29696A|nr:metallophosphoesterase [Paenibacillus sp. J31TS4]GIP39884.1 hypothetical protein J31TS4_31640 [Paenibacillus sp. J31TS4]